MEYEVVRVKLMTSYVFLLELKHVLSEFFFITNTQFGYELCFVGMATSSQQAKIINFTNEEFVCTEIMTFVISKKIVDMMMIFFNIFFS